MIIAKIQKNMDLRYFDIVSTMIFQNKFNG